MAEEVLGHVEHAWQVQIDQRGALPPLDDGGVAGPDGRFDVYLWRGLEVRYGSQKVQSARSVLPCG
jgi:hypothetical protein